MSWKKMPLGWKIGSGFIIVLLLLAVCVVLSYTGVGGIVENATAVIEGNRLDGMLAQREVDHLNWTNRVNNLLTDDSVTELKVETEDHKCAFGKWLYGPERRQAEKLVPSLAPLFKQVEEPHRELHESAKEIKRVFRQGDLELAGMLRERKADHLSWTHKIKDVFLNPALTRADVITDPYDCKLGKWLYSPELAEEMKKNPELASIWRDLEKPHQLLHKSVEQINSLLAEGRRDEALDYFKNVTLKAARETIAQIDRLIALNDENLKGMRDAIGVYSTKTVPTLLTIQDLLQKIRTETRNNIMTDEAMLTAAHSTRRNVGLVGGAAFIIGILLAFLISRSISGTLGRTSSTIDDAADQVAVASRQVSSASQELAEGASEYAAALEETSSSMEEMASMTRQNADNSAQANSLMNLAENIVVRAGDSMKQVTRSMDEISVAGQEIGKIIKTIDEIAFQTNLLALNAAVEAARAGEAGAGFAVVAEEVRNLAQRAAEAAQNTADLIEKTTQRIAQGNDLVKTTDDAFEEVADNVKKVGRLVGEISAASSEQTDGIDQVNTTLTQMDKVTQQNAASAEETASAAEELNAQAESMKDAVMNLMEMVRGAGAAETAAGGFKAGKPQKKQGPAGRRREQDRPGG